MSAFMDALQSCTGLSVPHSCSNGPLRCSSLGAERGREAQWTPCCWRWACALMDALRLHPYDKSNKRASLSLSSVSSAFFQAPPSTSNREKGPNCLLWEPKIIEPPIFLPPLPFPPLFQARYFFLSVILSERQGKKSAGIFLRNVNAREPKIPTLAVRHCTFTLKTGQCFPIFSDRWRLNKEKVWKFCIQKLDASTTHMKCILAGVPLALSYLL